MFQSIHSFVVYQFHELLLMCWWIKILSFLLNEAHDTMMDIYVTKYMVCVSVGLNDNMLEQINFIDWCSTAYSYHLQ